MDLSVIICSYDRYDLLAQAVSAVLDCPSFSPKTMELVVVENTPKAQRRPIELGKGGRLVVCEETGLSHARNAGLDTALGEIVAFVDDDAMIHDGWCAAVIGAFEAHPRAAVCGGKTLPRYTAAPKPIWFYDELPRYLSCIDWGEEVRPLRPGEWIVGANMAFRRDVFDKAGRFDPALGRKGVGSLLSNEEIALLRKVGRDRVFYVPDMVVDHMVPDERITLEWFRKRVFWQAVSDALSGEAFLTAQEAASELHKIVSRTPAEIRGHRLRSYAPGSPAALKDQLRAIYADTILMADGFPAEAMRG